MSTLPLVDPHGRHHQYLRISVTDRCNLRCLYCMPESGLDWKPKETLLTFEEITRLTRSLARAGVRKVRLTGGEPTLRQNIEGLISELVAIGGIESVGMTTNAVTLAQQAQVLKDSGLAHLNISLDTLQPLRFERLTRRGYFRQVMAGVEAAMAVGFESLKLNVVVMRGHNADELLDFVEFVSDKPLNVRFIEFMPFLDNHWQSNLLVPYQEMRRTIETQYDLIPIVTEASAVAKDFAVEGFQGTVSFITSMTESFCGGCNRIRLTADGGIKPCLHDNAEVNLRQALRAGASDDELVALVTQALGYKQKEHLPMETLSQVTQHVMSQIGG